MLIFVIIPFIIAALKKFSFKNLFLKPDLYPVFILELVHMFFQISFYFGNAKYVKYASALQISFILVLLFPIIKRKLYVPAVIGSVLTVFGTLMNKIVISANLGHMPVLPTISKLTGYYTEGQLSGNIDSLHILMSDATHLNFLGDYIDMGFCILSPGDVLIHAFVSIIVFYTIKSESEKLSGE